MSGNSPRQLVKRGRPRSSAPQRSPLLLESSLRYAALALPALTVIAVGLLTSPAASFLGGEAHSVSDGWKVLLGSLELSLGWRAATGAIWLLVLALPAGVLAPFSPARLVGWLIAGAVGVLAATILTPAPGLTPHEMILLTGGFACGVAIRRAAAGGQLVPVLAVLGAVAFILLLTLVPREGEPALRSPRLSLIGGRRGGADALANITLFMPLGLALAGAKLRLWQTVAIAGLLSLGVETAQYWIPGRAAAVGDVVMNTLGGLTGWLLLRPAAAIWQRRTPVAITLLVSAIAPTIIGGTGWLLAPVIREGEYRVQWTAPRRSMETYGGRLTAVRIGDHRLPPGTHPDLSDLLREGFLEGAPLVIEGIAGPRTARPSPLLRVVVRWGEPRRARETLAVIVSGDDALLRIGQRARQYRLFEPYHWLPGAFVPITTGESLNIEARREGRGWCLRVGATASCRLAFGVGDGWSLLVSSSGMPRAVRATLSWIWVLMLAVPAGLVAPARLRAALVHATGMVIAIAVAVWIPGTLVLRGWEAVLLIAGYCSALTVTRARRARRPRPAGPAPAAEPRRAATGMR